jgi:hypothetical protein
MKEALCKEFCDQVRISTVPDGIAVGTSFIGPDGDPIGFFVIGPNENGLFRVEDSGSTVPILEASGADLDLPSRSQAFNELLAQYDVLYDENRGELKTHSLDEAAVPRAALRFLTLLLRLQDLIYLAREKAENTFREEATRDLQSTIGNRATLTQNDIVDESLKEWPADIVLRAPQRKPIAIFLVMENAKLYEAMLLQMNAELKAKVECTVIALLETPTSVSQRVLNQAMNVLTPLHYRGDEKTAIGRIVRESLGFVSGTGAIH